MQRTICVLVMTSLVLLPSCSLARSSTQAVTISASDPGAELFADGQPIAITHDRAEVEATLRLTDSICRGVVSLEGKWWGQPDQTAAVTNLLSRSAWSRAGQPAYNDTFVQVVSRPR